MRLGNWLVGGCTALAFMALTGLPRLGPGNTLFVPTYSGAESSEIAGAASLRNTEMLLDILRGPWRGKPVGILAATSEGWGRTIPGLACERTADPRIAQAILDGDSVVVNRAMTDVINRHNARLVQGQKPIPTLDCRPQRHIY